MTRFVIIDGEIGAGKTTLINILKLHLSSKGLSVICVPEPVDSWVNCGILQKFYQNPQEYAYKFQTYTYISRIKVVLDALKQDPNPDYVLLERSILTDQFVFMELQRSYLDPILITMYNSWWGMYRYLIPFIDHARHIYLKPSLDICMERVEKRARDGEKTSTLSISYQHQLRRVHEAFLQGIGLDKCSYTKTDIPFDYSDVLVIETPANEDFKLNSSRICLLFDNWID
jgi:deoxyadenosine/deoxycytidine kinase